jgi:hypothetical protein
MRFKKRSGLGLISEAAVTCAYTPRRIAQDDESEAIQSLVPVGSVTYYSIKIEKAYEILYVYTM